MYVFNKINKINKQTDIQKKKNELRRKASKQLVELSLMIGVVHQRDKPSGTSVFMPEVPLHFTSEEGPGMVMSKSELNKHDNYVGCKHKNKIK